MARDTMLIEVSGINTAAMIGSSSPRTANHKPTILYKIEIPNVFDIPNSIQRARLDFVDLHFPDILSTMLIR
jgi:hypothetical protein